MKKIFIFTLLFSFNLQAQVECETEHDDLFDGHVHKILEWFGADDKQVGDAPCKSKTLPTETEINGIIQNHSHGKENATVHGVQFKDEAPELIEAFKHFTTAMDMFGLNTNPNKQKALQSEYKINPSCNKVMCAMEKIWGKDMAQKMMFLKLKHGFNTSELAFQYSDRFTKEELDDVILGIEDLPKNLFPLGKGKNQRLTHYLRGYSMDDENWETMANAVVMLFDAWSRESRNSRQYNIFHEMAHNISTSLSDLDNSPEWLNLSGWIKKGEDWSHSPKGCFTSEYGQYNPDEDFAEALSSYRYNAKSIKKLCPDKYEFLKKNVFNGLEYLETKYCRELTSEQVTKAGDILAPELIKDLGNKSFSQEELKEVCKQSISTYPVSENDLANCSLKLHLNKIEPEKLKQLLSPLNIEDTKTNREQIIASLKEKFNSSKDTNKNIAQKSKGITEALEAVVQKSFMEANPKDFGQNELSVTSHKWNAAREKCGETFFKNNLKEVKECMLRSINSEDQAKQELNQGLFPKYQVPSIFKEAAFENLMAQRESSLVNFLSNHPVTEEVVKNKYKDFQTSLKNHKSSVSLKLSQLKDWNKLSPEEFCKNTYGSGSIFTVSFGYPEGKELPVLHNKCIEIQSKKSKRFEFKDKNWNELISSIAP